MLALRSHLVSADAAASEELQQVPVTVLESAEAEALEEVSGPARCANTEQALTIQPVKEAKWLTRLYQNQTSTNSAGRFR